MLIVEGLQLLEKSGIDLLQFSTDTLAHLRHLLSRGLIVKARRVQSCHDGEDANVHCEIHVDESFHGVR